MEHERYIKKCVQNNSLQKVSFLKRDGDSVEEIKNILFLCPFGSHLYGTEGKHSDLDLKGIYMPSLREIILEEDEKTIRFSNGENRNSTNEGDLDVEIIDLRKFISDAISGQTYAVELLHCPNELQIISTDLSEFLFSEKQRLISSKVKPFLGYCQAQAKKYSLKGKRLDELEKVNKLLGSKSPSSRLKIILSEIELDNFNYVNLVEKEIHNQSDSLKLLKIDQKQYNLHAEIRSVKNSLEKVLSKYGNRAHKAKDGIDWKAIYHAYRVAFELGELLKTGQIQFPLQKAPFLKKVKKR